MKPNLLIITLTSLAFLISLIALILIINFSASFSDTGRLILRFDFDRGINKFGSLSSFYAFWAVGSLYLLSNAFISSFLFSRSRRLALVSSFASLLSALLILINVGVIIGLN